MATRPSLYRAVPKTKNKAKDYNENFDKMMDFIDASLLESKNYVDGFMPSVSGQAGKYLTNNGSTASWKSLGDLPSASMIEGLIVTKYNANTIRVSKGSCYDATKTVILTLANATNKSNGSQLDDHTYYVYIIGNGSTSVDILIDDSSSSPTMPTGYTYKRQIGYYKTDDEGEISSVSYYGVDSNAPRSAELGIFPDYTAGIEMPNGTAVPAGNYSYTAPSDGWISICAGGGNAGTLTVSINENIIGKIKGQATSVYYSAGVQAYVKSGDVIDYTKGTNIEMYAYFFPLS